MVYTCLPSGTDWSLLMPTTLEAIAGSSDCNVDGGPVASLVSRVFLAGMKTAVLPDMDDDDVDSVVTSS